MWRRLEDSRIEYEGLRDNLSDLLHNNRIDALSGFIEEWTDRMKEIAYNLYWKVAGEIEARVAQLRMDMPEKARRNILYKTLEGIDRADQIIIEDYLNSINKSINAIKSSSNKKKLRHNKNDVSAFHLSRKLYELSNYIFKKESEEGYEKEIKDYIKNLPEDVNRSRGIYYLSKDGKRAFRVNTSIVNFDENIQETSYGFEVVDWYNLEKLSAEQLKKVQDEYKKDARVLGSLLTQYESEHGGSYNSDSLSTNRETDRNNDGLDKETSSRESFGGRDTRNSRNYYGTDSRGVRSIPNGFKFGVFEGANMPIAEIMEALGDRGILTEEQWNDRTLEEMERELQCLGA